jgi:hypothetical protein
MLSPAEFHVGDLANAAAAGLTLFKPRNEYEEPMLFAAGEKMAISLGGRYAFHALRFEEAEAHKWAGLVIPGVSLEVDETSAFDAGNSRAPAGCLVRMGTTLACMANVEDGSFTRLQNVSLVDGLTACADGQKAGFPKWRIVLGEGEEKRLLLAIDLLEKKAETARS